MISQAIQEARQQIFGERPDDINLSVANNMTRAYLDPIIEEFETYKQAHQNGTQQKHHLHTLSFAMQLAARYPQEMKPVCNEIGEGAHEHVQELTNRFVALYEGLFPLPKPPKL